MTINIHEYPELLGEAREFFASKSVDEKTKSSETVVDHTPVDVKSVNEKTKSSETVVDHTPVDVKGKADISKFETLAAKFLDLAKTNQKQADEFNKDKELLSVKSQTLKELVKQLQTVRVDIAKQQTELSRLEEQAKKQSEQAANDSQELTRIKNQLEIDIKLKEEKEKALPAIKDQLATAEQISEQSQKAYTQIDKDFKTAERNYKQIELDIESYAKQITVLTESLKIKQEEIKAIQAINASSTNITKISDSIDVDKGSLDEINKNKSLKEKEKADTFTLVEELRKKWEDANSDKDGKHNFLQTLTKQKQEEDLSISGLNEKISKGQDDLGIATQKKLDSEKSFNSLQNELTSKKGVLETFKTEQQKIVVRLNEQASSIPLSINFDLENIDDIGNILDKLANELQEKANKNSIDAQKYQQDADSLKAKAESLDKLIKDYQKHAVAIETQSALVADYKAKLEEYATNAKKSEDQFQQLYNLVSVDKKLKDKEEQELTQLTNKLKEVEQKTEKAEASFVALDQQKRDFYVQFNDLQLKIKEHADQISTAIESIKLKRLELKTALELKDDILITKLNGEIATIKQSIKEPKSQIEILNLQQADLYQKLQQIEHDWDMAYNFRAGNHTSLIDLTKQKTQQDLKVVGFNIKINKEESEVSLAADYVQGNKTLHLDAENTFNENLAVLREYENKVTQLLGNITNSLEEA